jgi:DNA repair protein RecN (Recombination protein N)
MGRSHIRIDVRQRDDAAGISLDASGEGRTVHLDETGIDEVEFLIAPNAGEALKPLTRIASGGETARLMLATKSILSDVDRTPTLVFDEIDVGVGGRSGQVVGEKLWGIARKHQVIVVSHLPQVAAFADTHLRIEKYDSDGRTLSEVRTLDDEERELELAAMLDGSPVTDAARQNARSMLDRSRSYITAATGG